ncbi:conserved Plasmodium protein, unknown function [Plasmodium knowlesi strain H]|uniref:Uncharacterized protein n=3 Tax=Plasmodium knowlesi TaxID=5850 RepID=A0A5K1UEU4_PLAKH|nr:conserved protein, unknown function [Plasmodium knowlesi strain H]OTN67069.1 Uncharacterized protein PKNOH_S07442300 [Plasmodium knowlesi]CAA9988552.1 conserved protein, unknown function [Plasmodium knowlesi strain H]SBO21343.1 conserved Plasmodium protein, unknown function [Plasmodium knowlesi strain H]SBO21796.1 conserved Plasmodium protein, unknown function [Plasmodium knowlesi strain H]VVS78026.1 conserved protein, unknown function [Plasmodium knowlesi strain H]|eukprot:XP_002259528.1 hypothetical protein, conserved in Plasmodium species [Plasmodium knowlesi strain H]
MKRENDGDDSFAFPPERDICNLYRKDHYMKHCHVKNHIEPISLEDEVHILKREEHQSFKLSDILKSLEKIKEEKNKPPSEDIILPEYVEHEKVEQEEESRERIHCGVYLHEVNITDNSYFHSRYDDMIDDYSNPIRIKGDMYVNNIVHFEDSSTYRSVFQVHRVEWFLGLEINEKRIHEIVPYSQGMSFRIPFEALGKYIFCKAYRNVHLNSEYQKGASNTVFDPHTLQKKPVKFKADPKCIEKCSITSKGPVLISINSAFQILTFLCNNNYSIQVIVEDPLDNFCNLSASSLSDDETVTTTSNATNRTDEKNCFLATLSINFDEIKFRLTNLENVEEDQPPSGATCDAQIPKRNNDKRRNSAFNFFRPFELQNDGAHNSSYSRAEKKNNLNSDEDGEKSAEGMKSLQSAGLSAEKKGNLKMEGKKTELTLNLYEVEFRLSSKDDCVVVSIGIDLQRFFKFVKYKMVTIKPVEKNTSANDLWLILVAFKSAQSYKEVLKKNAKIIYTNTNISFVQNIVNNYLTKSMECNADGAMPLQKINTIFNETG